MEEPMNRYLGVSMFTKHEDGSTTVDEWYRHMPFSAMLIGEWQAGLNNRVATIWYDPDLMDDIVTLTVANGKATYRLGQPDPQTMTRIGTLIKAELDIPAEQVGEA